MTEIRPIEVFQDFEPHRIIIAGPCSAESEEQVMKTAQRLAAAGVRIFRAGIWKPRTKPGCFEGIGIPGLTWLQNVRKETGMAVATEVANARHVQEALKAGIDILWIGARTTVNPFAVQEIADSLKGVDIPVLVKNPVNPELELWTGALERLDKAGIRRLAAIHRGFSTYGEHIYRNSPQWQIPIELRRRIPELPILCDPSHMGGHRDFILQLSQHALDLCADGLFIEVHCDPCHALSDACQQLTPDEFNSVCSQLVTRSESYSADDQLNAFRDRIDVCDRQIIDILSRRFRIAAEIGEFKKNNNLAILQSKRYQSIISTLMSEGEKRGIDPSCIKSIFESIHIESIRQQLEIMNSHKNNGSGK